MMVSEVGVCTKDTGESPLIKFRSCIDPTDPPSETRCIGVSGAGYYSGPFESLQSIATLKETCRSCNIQKQLVVDSSAESVDHVTHEQI